jgi:pimeloyl-ACP methyl ester carboxylesterase
MSVLLPHQSSPIKRGFPVVLIHGAAVTARIWDRVITALGSHDVRAPQRAYSGCLDDEVEALAPLCAGAVVVGVSGGATLGLELAARGVPFERAVLHEPAVGSLLPGLLTPMAEAFQRGGVGEFGRTLYGSSWSPSDAPPADAVARDLAMFRAFEPSPPAARGGTVFITVGAQSPPIRHRAARALQDAFGYEFHVVPGAGHAVHLEAPEALAALVLA